MQIIRTRHFYHIRIPVIILFLVISAWSQDISLPVKTQVQIFLKMLTFDRNLEQRAGNDLVFGIIYQARFITSYNIKNDFQEELTNTVHQINGFTIHNVLVDLEAEDLEKAIIDNKIDILYITPLRAFDLNKILHISRQKNILTLSGVPEYVQSGVTAGVTIKDNKPQILVNLSSAKLENIDFSSQLLKLARIYE